MNLTLEEFNNLSIILQHIDNKTNRVNLDVWGINEIDKILEYTCNEEPLFTSFIGANTAEFYINPYVYNNGLNPTDEKFLKGVFRAKGGLD